VLAARGLSGAASSGAKSRARRARPGHVQASPAPLRRAGPERARGRQVDLHTNVVGGLLLSEPATDLAVALAIASSFHEQPIAADLAAIGEIGRAAARAWG